MSQDFANIAGVTMKLPAAVGPANSLHSGLQVNDISISPNLVVSNYHAVTIINTGAGDRS